MIYGNFKDLHKAYGFDDSNRTREQLSLEEERAFVRDCFDTYEHIGFVAVFNTPYESEKQYEGQKFEVLGRCDESTHDLEVLPVWKIRLESGAEIEAYPEEICLAERNK